MKKEKSQVIKTIKKVVPSVVMVAVTKSLETLKEEYKQEQKNHRKTSDFFHFSIPKNKIDAHGMVQVDGGSGFIADEKGIIITNKHVISELDAEYSVITNDNEHYSAKLLARDPVNDVAILKIESRFKLVAMELGDSDNLELGQTVLAFGNALGIFKNTISLGIISGLSRSITAHTEPKAPAQEMRGLIQTDAAINPGNSGGPLTDIFGHVIGINAAMIAGAENISFAIPIKTVERDLKDLKKFGKIRRPLLGLHYLLIHKDLKEKINLPVDYGALVVREHPLDKAVIPGSPAEKAGILENDILLSWGEEKITHEKSILDLLEDQNVGDGVRVKVLRNGKEMEFTIVLGERK